MRRVKGKECTWNVLTVRKCTLSIYIYYVLGCEDEKSQGKRVYLKCTHCKEVYSIYIYYVLGCEEEKSQGKRVYLKCTHCKEVFSGAWDLMFHVQSAHSVNIYSLGDSKKKVKLLKIKRVEKMETMELNFCQKLQLQPNVA